MDRDKINQQDIVDQLSARLNISKKLAEEFLKTLFPIIEDALLAGEHVKIKNFGTLKVQWNLPRKSVNVNTGEEIILDGYNKVVFATEEGLRELVNEPFAHLSPVSLDEPQSEEIPEDGPLRVINNQVLEIKNLLSEINQLNHLNKENSADDFEDFEDLEELESIETVPETEEVSETEVISELHQPENTVISEEELDKPTEELNDIIEEIAEEDKIEASENILVEEINAEISEDEFEAPTEILPENIEEIAEEDKIETSEIISDEEIKPVAEKSSEKIADIPTLIMSKLEPTETRKGIALKWWLSGAAVVVGAFLLLYFFNLNFYRFVNDKVSAFSPQQHISNEADLIFPDTTVVPTVDSAKIMEDLFFDKLLSDNRKYEQEITKERIRKGNNLRNFAQKYYGHPAFWIYIYEANKEKIPDTLAIKRGTILKIPVIDSMLIDTTNIRSFAMAGNLEKLLFEKKVDLQEEDIESNQTEIATETTISGNTSTEPELLATEKIGEGSRLTLYARKYYGSREFWVYIYEANRDVIKNPDYVPVGTIIKIPKLSNELIDKNNPENMLKAKELQKKYLKK